MGDEIAADETYRLNPHFRRLMGIVKPVGLAAAAWQIAKEAFLPEGPEAEFEVWQDDEMVAGASGPRLKALEEVVRYAMVYQTDDKPCTIQEVFRREVDPDRAHYLLATAQGAATNA